MLQTAMLRMIFHDSEVPYFLTFLSVCLQSITKLTMYVKGLESGYRLKI